MGRKSRMKAETRAQRKPRTVAIYNPRLGQHEQHQVTISDDSLGEWVRDRERLTQRGYPDRPPIYDDPKIRAWAPCPEEPFDASRRTTESFAGSWATRQRELDWDLKVVAFRAPDDGFVVDSKISSGQLGVMAHEFHFGSWAEVLAYVDQSIDFWDMIDCSKPIVVTREEMDFVGQELRLQDRDDKISAA